MVITSAVSGGVAALAQKNIGIQKTNVQGGGSEESSEKVDNAVEEKAEGDQQGAKLQASSAGTKGAQVNIVA